MESASSRVLALVLWGIASLVSQNGSGATANLASNVFRPGSVQRYAAIIEQDGPVLFPDLLGTDGDKSVVLDHVGANPMEGWRIYLGHPGRSADLLQGHCRCSTPTSSPIAKAGPWPSMGWRCPAQGSRPW